jgi:hypothetical protein
VEPGEKAELTQEKDTWQGDKSWLERRSGIDICK